MIGHGKSWNHKLDCDNDVHDNDADESSQDNENIETDY